MNRALIALLAVAALLPACSGPGAPPPAPPEAAPAKEPMTGSHPGDRVPAFRATVLRAAKPEPFDSRATKGATLYIVNSTTCPYCSSYAGRMKEIETAFIPKGVDVVHVYPVRAEPEEEKIAWHAEKGFLGGQVIDGDASIAKSLTADRTPTVYLVDAKGVLVYRGAIDDAPDGGKVGARYLADAIDALLAGKPIATASTEPAG